MANETYSIPLEDGFCVVTESNRGARGWAFTPVADVPDSDYVVNELVAGIKWTDGVDPREAGADAGAWGRPRPPTDAVDDRLRTSYSMGVHADRGDVSVYGVRKSDDATALLFRALKASENLL